MITPEEIKGLENNNLLIGYYYLDAEECPEMFMVWDELTGKTVLDLGYSTVQKKIAVVYSKVEGKGKEDKIERTIIGYIPLPYDGDEFLKVLAAGCFDFSSCVECKIVSKTDQKVRVGLWIKKR